MILRGLGVLSVAYWPMDEQVKCPYCEDVPPWEECDECDGTGFIWEERLDA